MFKHLVFRALIEQITEAGWEGQDADGKIKEPLGGTEEEGTTKHQSKVHWSELVFQQIDDVSLS
jgi:hypothetical protein